MQENSFCAEKFLQNRNLSFTGPIDLKAPNLQNSQLAFFSDKGIGAQPVAELWGRMGDTSPINVNITCIWILNLLEKSNQ